MSASALPKENPEIPLKEAALILRVSNDTAERLFSKGLITGRRPSPKCIFINRASVLAHAEKTQDPKFWAKYQEGHAN